MRTTEIRLTGRAATPFAAGDMPPVRGAERSPRPTSAIRAVLLAFPLIAFSVPDLAVGGVPSPRMPVETSGVGAPRPQLKEVREIRHAVDDSVMMVIPATEFLMGTAEAHTDLPVVVGFGIKTADDAAAMGRDSNGVAVGTAICNAVRDSLDGGKATPGTVSAVTTMVAGLASGVRRARA